MVKGAKTSDWERKEAHICTKKVFKNQVERKGKETMLLALLTVLTHHNNTKMENF